ncbi:transposase [Xenorhabdus poinarii G6]|uniref:Transposase n=1 Tax=Xenorhabdus poinarii G6 TaxID=1354304 RepID=A0A068QZG5_9GAMM|nr:transposase [Xenorhabdus poinarii]CDG20179.1 transposase [Xenorhabdus poinarii G6]
MKQYSIKQKSAIQKKLLPPHNISVPFLAKTEGISKTTLYRWRKEALTSAPDNIINQLQKENRYLKRKLAYKSKIRSVKNHWNTLIKTLFTIYFLIRQLF